ncbi:MAG TPA: HAD-IA family hydrolase [Acidimicrobiales bacterium]|nr:HAD-IA family hydrolase [Acidimicrobiales bacterium]
MPIRAALFDFGGVISTSPFEAFNRYEVANGLPENFLRGLNATNSDSNAWARHERNELSFDEFCDAYEAEAADAGHRLDARAVISGLSGAIRPDMIEAIGRCHERLRTGLITNNMAPMSEGDSPMLSFVEGLFDVIIESSKMGVRKPDPKIYEIACDELGAQPSEIVFLDDLGVNLKPAAAMGMTTIKVYDASQAISALEAVVGFALRA